MLQPCLVDRESFTVAKNYGTLHHILQFADIARPMICLKQLQRPLLDISDPLSDLVRVSPNEIFDQHGNVPRTFAERRYLDWKHIQPVEQIHPERARVNGGLQ